MSKTSRWGRVSSGMFGRRDWLFGAAAGVLSLALPAGASSTPHVVNPSGDDGPVPGLRRDVARTQAAAGPVLELADGTRLAVNSEGARILPFLDGRHRLSEIARALSADGNPTERDLARIARFIAELGQEGCLDAPYWVYIVCNVA